MFTHKKNPKYKSELFQMKFTLPNLPMVLPLKPALVCSNIINDRGNFRYIQPISATIADTKVRLSYAKRALLREIIKLSADIK
jgi:hypothetical protein